MSKISEETPKTSPDSTDLFIIEDVNGNLRSMTYENLIGDEAADRESADTAIQAGAGLGIDGSYTPPTGTNYINSAAFVDAGYSASQANALKLLDTAIYNVNGKIFLSEQVAVTSAELLKIKDTPKTVISAPAAGIFIDPQEVIGNYVKGTTDYTHTTNPLIVKFNGGDTLFTFSQNFLTSGNRIEKANPSFNVSMDTATAIELYSDTEPTGGDGTLDLFLYYRLVDSASISLPVVNRTCCTLAVSGTFTNASLTAGKLTVTHNLGTSKISVTIINNAGVSETLSFVLGDSTGTDPTNKVTFDVGTIAGTWSYIILADNPNL